MSVYPAGYQSSRAVTVSDTVLISPSTGFAIICGTAGNVKVSLVGGTLTFPVPVGLTILPLAVTQLWSTGTTAVATYAALN